MATCLGRMVNWWKLVEAVLETEFPDWDLLLQFTAFHVPSDLATSPATRGQLQTLSNAFGLNSDSLSSEYEALRPIANKFAKQTPNVLDCSARAWKNALCTCGGRCQARETLPIVEPAASFVALRGLRRLIQRSGTDV